jgi:hypothetical protein
MNCRERQEFFSDLYDGNLPGDRRGDLESHLSSCGDCRSEYEVFSSSLHALREAPQAAPGEAFVRKVVESARGETERQALFQNTGLRRPTTRRHTSPRRAVWAVPAIAAAALVAFAVGFFVQKQASDRRIDELQQALAKEMNAVQPPVSTPGLSVEEVRKQLIEEYRLVPVEGAWMSSTVRDRLNRGEVWLGDKWVDSKLEIDKQVAAEMAKLSGDPDPKAVEEKVLQAHGLVRRGDWFVPRSWAAALDAGMVLDPAGEPRALAAIVADRLRDLGLVEHDGKWMSREEKTELAANPKIQKGPAAPATAVTKILDGLAIGPPLGFRNLMLYPLTGPVEKAPGVASLAEALAADRVEIVEEGNALQVKIRNKGDVDLALMAGDLLVGGRHGRVVARDVLVAAKKDRTIDVFDSEPAELRPEKPPFRRDGGSGQAWAPVGMRRLLNDETGQAGVWASLLFAGSRTSVPDLLRDHKAAIAEYRAAMGNLRATHPNMTGVAIAIGNSIAILEVYGSPALFGANFDRVVESAAIEAIVMNRRETAYPSDLPAGPLSVRRLAESAFTAEHDADGDAILVRRNDRVIGRALVANGDAVRVVLFPDAPAPARPPLDAPIPVAKVRHVLAAYMMNRRAATLREMAMLPGDLPRAAVLDQAKPGNPLRKDAIEALGLRGDPAAAEPLVRLLKEKDPALYATVALALARLRSEEAIPVLIGDIDPRNLPIAKIAAEYLPGLLLSMRDVHKLESGISNLIAKINQVPPEPNADPGAAWTVKTLRLVTGLSFATTMDYDLWWRDLAKRQDFLERHRQ